MLKELIGTCPTLKIKVSDIFQPCVEHIPTL